MADSEDSDRESDRRLPEINRDHEDDEPAGQAAPAERDHARNEHGDDEGTPPLIDQSQC